MTGNETPPAEPVGPPMHTSEDDAAYSRRVMAELRRGQQMARQAEEMVRAAQGAEASYRSWLAYQTEKYALAPGDRIEEDGAIVRAAERAG